MFRKILWSVVVGFALSAVPQSAMAQSGDLHVGLSYDLVYHEVDDTSNGGFHADVSKGPRNGINWLGEVGLNHFFRRTVTSYQGGVRLPMGEKYYTPFVQILAGIYHCNACDSTDFSLQPGFGVDFRPKGRSFEVRAQFDVRHVFIKGFEDYNGFRLSGGIVLPISLQ